MPESTKPKPACPPELETIFSDIRTALNSGLHYLALMVTLALPDFCVTLSGSFGIKKSYLLWCEKYVVSRFRSITADDCYRFRCGVVHNGHFGRPDDNFDRIIFTIPQPGIGRVLEMTIKDSNINGCDDNVLALDIVAFCDRFIEGAQQWMEENGENETVRSNLAGLVRYRPGGYPPYIGGLPVVA